MRRTSSDTCRRKAAKEAPSAAGPCSATAGGCPAPLAAAGAGASSTGAAGGVAERGGALVPAPGAGRPSPRSSASTCSGTSPGTGGGEAGCAPAAAPALPLRTSWPGLRRRGGGDRLGEKVHSASSRAWCSEGAGVRGVGWRQGRSSSACTQALTAVAHLMLADRRRRRRAPRLRLALQRRGVGSQVLLGGDAPLHRSIPAPSSSGGNGRAEGAVCDCGLLGLAARLRLGGGSSR